MLRHRKADCCEYREQKRKLALKRLRKMENERSKKTKMADDCDKDEDYEEQKRKCDKKTFNAPPKLPKYRSFLDETMDRIKPSIKNREKYTADSRHIRCFLEAEELKQLRDEERTIRGYRREPCDSAQRNFEATRAKKKTQSTQQPAANASEENDAGESRNAVDNQETSDESASDESKKNTKKKLRDEKNEFWCSELKNKRKKMNSLSNYPTQSSCDSIDCEDSICSFDSQINLSGVTLTTEEKRNIRKNARNRVRSPDQ